MSANAKIILPSGLIEKYRNAAAGGKSLFVPKLEKIWGVGMAMKTKDTQNAHPDFSFII